MRKIGFSSVLFCFFIISFAFSPFSNVKAAQAANAINIGAEDAWVNFENLVAALPNSAFKKSNQKTALLNKSNAVVNQLEAGAYKGIIKKLQNDIKDKILKWVTPSQQFALLEALDVTLQAVENASYTTVKTSYGRLAGADAGNDSWVWKGVPYAKPPVGELRWKAPQNPEPWDGVRYSTDKFTPAVQPGMSVLWIPQNEILGSEDCLYVNIFRPKTVQKNLPVYMWIHGGSNWFGGAANYDGSIIAGKLNMVVVVIQYRLGPFGWFYVPALNPKGTSEDRSGNYGTIDTIQALKWIKGNIAAFGGNPNNVTVAGQSAGATNTFNILVSPLAEDLFHRAMPISGRPSGSSIATCSAQANANIEQLLVNDGTCTVEGAAAYRENMSDAQLEAYLRGKTAYEIEAARMNDRGSIDSVSPCIDGAVLPDAAFSLISAGKCNQVPVMLGSTKYEMKNFLPLYFGDKTTSTGKTWLDVYKVLEGELAFEDVFATDADKIAYEAAAYGMSQTGVGTMQVANALITYQDDVYGYLFQWGGPGSGPHPFDFIIGPAHACDIPFWFGWNRDLTGYSFVDDPSMPYYNKPGRIELQHDMMTYMRQFAATGNPNSPATGLPVWTEWSNEPDAENFMSFDSTFLDATIGMISLP